MAMLMRKSKSRQDPVQPSAIVKSTMGLRMVCGMMVQGISEVERAGAQVARIEGRVFHHKLKWLGLA